MRILTLAIMLCAAGPAQLLKVPAGLDAYMPVPSTNPLTAEKVILGKKLFFDTSLSADGKISCASCHDPKLSFTDARPVAAGIGGASGTRRAPRLVNRGYGKVFFWDGRAISLEEQVLQPVANPIEMGSTAEDAARRAGVTVATLRDALATYVRSMLSGNSPYDRYMAGDGGALDNAAKLGMRLFTGKAGCATCHAGPNFSDEQFHNTGAGDGTDPGRFSVTKRLTDWAAFKTPSLRDAARTPPYMHDGSIATLEDVVTFYDKGGKANPQLDGEMRPLHLSEPEKAALLAFLRSLNGQVSDGL